MSFGEDPAFLSASRVLPSDRDLERLTCALRMAAGENNLSRRTIDRYQAWIFGYISWSLRTEPFKVSDRRISDFLDAIKRHPEAGKEEAFEAMDALGFLYGALDEPDVLLCFDTDEKERDASTFRGWRAQEHPRRERMIYGTGFAADEKISSLRIGWAKGR